MLVGTPEERAEHTATGKKPEGARFIPMLGQFKINDITTSDIRAWHKTLSQEVGTYSANRAKQFLGTALALAAENYNIRPPALPRRIGREKQREKKTILTPDQVATLLRHAQQDEERVIYSAFLFLSGCRPSEMLALLWEDVDLESRQIHIRRMQEPNGDITNFTKTEAGTRTIPMSGLLHSMLLRWKLRCPRLNGELYRVFPGPGRLQPWPLSVSNLCMARFQNPA